MENKRFLVIRIIVIVLSILSLISIELYQRKLIRDEQKVIIEEKNKINENVIVDASKLYITNKQDYYSDLLKDNIEIRIDTDDLVKSKLINNNKGFKGYVKVKDDEFTFVKNENMLIDKMISKDYVSNSNNEKDAYDLKYIYKGDDPNNYIKFKDKLYRIIGITNSNNLKVISMDNTTISKWGLSGDVNYLKTNEKIEEDGYKGIFYVGYVRSETNDVASIIKNEKRNNTYTVSSPKYVGVYSYINISDIVNAADECDFYKINGINMDNCHSYLLDMNSNSYTSISLENNMVYKVNDKKEITTTKPEENINIKKVIYISGYDEYKSGDGSKNNPYEVK